MSIPAKNITEKELQSYISDLLQTMGLTCVAEQLQLGAYKLDAIALDKKRRKIVVVELKTCAHIGSLGQLLLYRSALMQTLAHVAPEADYEVDALLITTFLDREVVDVIHGLGLDDKIRVKVCVGDSAHFLLEDPHDAPRDQAWHQRLKKLAPSLADKIKNWDLS